MCTPMFLGAGPPFCALSDMTRNLTKISQKSHGGLHLVGKWLRARGKPPWDGSLTFGWHNVNCMCMLCYASVKKNRVCANTSNIVILLLLLLFISFLGGYFSGPSKCLASNWYPCLFCHFVHLVSHLWSVRPLWWTVLRCWSGAKGGTGVWNAVKPRGRKVSIGPSPFGRRRSMKRLCCSIRTME